MPGCGYCHIRAHCSPSAGGSHSASQRSNQKNSLGQSQEFGPQLWWSHLLVKLKASILATAQCTLKPHPTICRHASPIAHNAHCLSHRISNPYKMHQSEVLLLLVFGLLMCPWAEQASAQHLSELFESFSDLSEGDPLLLRQHSFDHRSACCRRSAVVVRPRLSGQNTPGVPKSASIFWPPE